MVIRKQWSNRRPWAFLERDTFIVLDTQKRSLGSKLAGLMGPAAPGPGGQGDTEHLLVFLNAEEQSPCGDSDQCIDSGTNGRRRQ